MSKGQKIAMWVVSGLLTALFLFAAIAQILTPARCLAVGLRPVVPYRSLACVKRWAHWLAHTAAGRAGRRRPVWDHDRRRLHAGVAIT